MKWKINFQDGDHSSHLEFPIGTILATFALQVTPMFPTKFRVNWHLGLGEEAENGFSRWPPCGHLGFTIGTILAIFDLQVTPMPPTMFWVNWPFGAGEEPKTRFSRWQSWISDRNDFSYFWSTSHPDASYLVSSQLIWLWQPSWIYDRHGFSYFWSTSHPNASYQVLRQLAFGFRRRS